MQPISLTSLATTLIKLRRVPNFLKKAQPVNAVPVIPNMKELHHKALPDKHNKPFCQMFSQKRKMLERKQPTCFSPKSHQCLTALHLIRA